jgi:hypothetical protein
MKAIFKDEYWKMVPLWMKNASKVEMKGLKLTTQIVKNQGLRRFRPSKTITPVVSSKSIYKVQSQYSEAFSENVIQKVFESEVLKFVNLSSMPVSRILRSEVLMFLERWLGLGDEESYQNYVLSFIKGFFTVIKVNNSIQMSTARESYSRKKIERNTVFGRKKWVDQEPRIKLPEIKNSKSVEFVQPRTSIKDIKEYVSKDKGDILRWITGNNPFKTVYQDQFHSRSLQAVSPLKKDFYTSTSIKLLPDIPLDKIN